MADGAAAASYASVRTSVFFNVAAKAGRQLAAVILVLQLCSFSRFNDLAAALPPSSRIYKFSAGNDATYTYAGDKRTDVT